MSRISLTDDLDLGGHRIRDWRWLDDLPTDGASEGQVLRVTSAGPRWTDGEGGEPGPEGPQGPQGPQGPEGPEGPPGPVPDGDNPGDILEWDGGGWAPVPHTFSYTDLDDVPASFAPSAHTHSASEVTAGTFGAGNFVVAGDLSVTGDVYVRSGGPDGTGRVFFYSGSPSGKYIQWAHAANEFQANGRIRIQAGAETTQLALQGTGTSCRMNMTSGGGYTNITESSNTLYLQPGGAAAMGAFSNQNVRVYGNFFCDNNISINYAGPDADSFLYFRDNSSNTGQHLKWNNASHFELSADTRAPVLRQGTQRVDQRITQGSDLSKTDDDTLDDTNLILPVEANKRYKVELSAVLKMPTLVTPNPAAKVKFDAPAGSALLWTRGYPDAAGTAASTLGDLGLYTVVSLVTRMAYATGILTVASTAGNFKVQFAQNVSSAATHIFGAESILEISQVN
jgi:hypothetical protein